MTTSGTLGDPVTFGCTEKDLQRLAYNEKKSFECAGVKKGNIVQLMTTIDKRFMAGLAYFLSGLSFDLIHCVANFIVGLVLWRPLDRALSHIEY